eukprot:TRINITY_DN10467_c0_g3_i1.p1 TRINITY_DN10467_c0_g3~~TRINITY_DN10467_c0_g3_i1.p1  ORF type:complete len:501 (-),score=109.06 TRINITY_DN10467_c0_g3_i1:486-1988(-)
MIRRPPRSTLSSSSAASDVYKRQVQDQTAQLAREEAARKQAVAAKAAERATKEQDSAARRIQAVHRGNAARHGAAEKKERHTLDCAAEEARRTKAIADQAEMQAQRARFVAEQVSSRCSGKARSKSVILALSAATEAEKAHRRDAELARALADNAERISKAVHAASAATAFEETRATQATADLESIKGAVRVAEIDREWEEQKARQGQRAFKDMLVSTMNMAASEGVFKDLLVSVTDAAACEKETEPVHVAPKAGQAPGSLADNAEGTSTSVSTARVATGAEEPRTTQATANLESGQSGVGAEPSCEDEHRLASDPPQPALHERPHDAPSATQDVFDEIDTNRDGVIDRTEFQAAAVSAPAAASAGSSPAPTIALVQSIQPVSAANTESDRERVLAETSAVLREELKEMRQEMAELRAFAHRAEATSQQSSGGSETRQKSAHDNGAMESALETGRAAATADQLGQRATAAAAAVEAERAAAGNAMALQAGNASQASVPTA